MRYSISAAKRGEIERLHPAGARRGQARLAGKDVGLGQPKFFAAEHQPAQTPAEGLRCIGRTELEAFSLRQGCYRHDLTPARHVDGQTIDLQVDSHPVTERGGRIDSFSQFKPHFDVSTTPGVDALAVLFPVFVWPRQEAPTHRINSPVRDHDPSPVKRTGDGSLASLVGLIDKNYKTVLLYLCSRSLAKNLGKAWLVLVTGFRGRGKQGRTNRPWGPVGRRASRNQRPGASPSIASKLFFVQSEMVVRNPPIEAKNIAEG
jgi:hypothetical protein